MEIDIRKSRVVMEPTMELRWAVEPNTSTKEMELQQAFWMIGESSKRKVWCSVPIHVKESQHPPTFASGL